MSFNAFPYLNLIAVSCNLTKSDHSQHLSWAEEFTDLVQNAYLHGQKICKRTYVKFVVARKKLEKFNGY